MEDKPKRTDSECRIAYIYCRTSTNNPVLLEAHKVECVNLCRREGLMVTGVFSDSNVPEYTVGPGLRELIRAWRTAGRTVCHFVTHPEPDAEWLIQTLNDALATSQTTSAGLEYPTPTDAAPVRLE